MADFIQKGDEGRIVDGVPEDLNQGIKFFGNRLCPYAHRSWWALKEKGVEVDYIHIELGPNKPAWYSQVNPFGTVPAFFDEGKSVFESLVLVEFLDERYKGQGTTLLPDDLFVRAQARALASKYGDRIKLHFALLQEPDQSKWPEAVKELREGYLSFFRDLEAVAGPSSGPYLLGDQVSLLDLAIFPFIDRYTAVLKHYRDVDLLPSDDPRFDRFRTAFEAVKQRPAFQATSQTPEYYVAAFSRLVK